MTSTIAPTVSLSGVLRRDVCPDWIPHDAHASETTAVDAIIAHMQCDALRPDCMDARTGPIHWHDKLRCYHAWGNFVICSAGFEITPITDRARAKLLAAWAIHYASPQYHIARQLEYIDAAMRRDLAIVSKISSHDYIRQPKEAAVRKRFALQWRPLEAQLMSIYNSAAH
jgi:hypothetical protein